MVFITTLKKTSSISPHCLWSKIYYLIIYLFNQGKQHIKSPDSDQANSIGKCILEWTGAGEKGYESFINNISKLS